MKIEINKETMAIAERHKIVQQFNDGTMQFDKDFMTYLEESAPTVLRKRKDDPSKIITHPLITKETIIAAVRQYIKNDEDWPYCAAVAVTAWETFFQVKWERMIAIDGLNKGK